MIYRGGKLVLEVEQNVQEIVDNVQQITQISIGAIYKGTQLVWRTVYKAIKSCYSSGTWLGDKPWTRDDLWKAFQFLLNGKKRNSSKSYYQL